MFQKGLFVFHRDFRLTDNITLNLASAKCKQLYCCFIFTPEQVGKSNAYRSPNAIQFMIESLEELYQDIQREGGELMTFYGNHISTLRQLIQHIGIEALYFNKDYSPYALEREQETIKLCSQLKIEFKALNDYYLYEPGTVTTGSGSVYKKYTPFYEAVIKRDVLPISRKKITNLSRYTGTKPASVISIATAFKKFTHGNPNILVHGGRTLGVQRLSKALLQQHDYTEKRDMLTYNTTFLSAYIKFGCVSVREVYHKIRNKFGSHSGIIRELIWREFFAHVLYGFPEVVGQSYNEKMRKIKWRTSEHDLALWKRGQTGFPIVDAGMRQLNETGYMHNRVRMMVASFLIKVLLLDWRLGEQYFAQKLTDYDIASNNGNWQGISGTGVDMKPYFRDMNPWIQSIKFDPKCEYIKKWVPELANIDPNDIHHWDEKWTKHPSTYIKPIVNYYDQKEKMLYLYKHA